MRMRMLQTQLIVLNDLSVISCPHFHEKYLFRRASRNVYFLFLSF